MRLHPFNLEDYPLLGIEMRINKGQIFRLENTEMEYGSGSKICSGLFMYTGIYQSDRKTRIDHLYCIPMYFYGKNSRLMSQRYSGKNVWLQLTEMYHQEVDLDFFANYDPRSMLN